jgi:hypothetical protein
MIMNSWEPFQFLIGSWTSPASGQPGEPVSGATTFSFDLDQQVIIRRSRAEFAPGPGEQAGPVHKDLLVIYRQPAEAGFRAIYFDNEGHVINYSVSFPAGQPAVVFESEANQAGPRARLVYEAVEPDTLSIEFFVAAPGGEFVSHVKGMVKR